MEEDNIEQQFFLTKNNPMYVINNQHSKERLGSTNINIQGERMIIIKYNNANDIDIRFEDTGHILYHQCYGNFLKGALKDYFLPTLYNHGILENSNIYDKDGKKRIEFIYWDDMLKRCYYQKDIEKYPTYRRCTVCDEWLHFPEFEKWFNTNYYKCGEEKMTLDKDILIKNNKIYSPQTSIFVPERINILFTKANKNRGKYPIGVYFKKQNGKFVAQVSKLKNETSNTKRQEYLGMFNTPEEAFFAYKTEKEKYIKEIADYYKNKYNNFPDILYKALYNYKVEITD